MRILFDQGTPVPLRRFRPDHQVATAYEQGCQVIQIMRRECDARRGHWPDDLLDLVFAVFAGPVASLRATG